jgi:hypothetical protein
VVGAGARDDTIGRQWQALSLQPFLRAESFYVFGSYLQLLRNV